MTEATPDDARDMRRALVLASRALGNTAPNPPVGALVVRDGVVLGEGWTRPAGSHHAEVVALNACREAGHDPRGATMVVTLEPCCHHGRTPPCTDAVVAAGIARVVVGVVDPFPPMRGQGLEALRRAGVEVVLGAESAACARSMRGFLKAVTLGLPEVTLKVASSLDGRIATAAGESKWITSEESRREGHALRGTHDAILVGIGTVRADDPALTCRLPGPERHPLPVVLDSRLSIAAGAKVLRGPRRAQVFCAEDAPERTLDAEIWRVATGADGRPDPIAVARQLVKLGVHRVLVEGGATVARSFLDAGLVDTLELFVAPVVLPGGLSWVGGPPVASLAEATRGEVLAVGSVGPDARLTIALPPSQ